MNTTDISQKEIDEFIATTDEFWRSYHQSLKAPYSLWHSHKDVTFEKWVEMVLNTPDLIAHLNILFEFPLLKNEFTIAFYNGFILTNFRLVINDVRVGKISIPLSNIQKYNINSDGVVEYELNGQYINFIYHELLNENIVNSAKARFSEVKLTDVQFSLLSKSVYDLNTTNTDLVIPTLVMYRLTKGKQIDIEQNVSPDEPSKTKKKSPLSVLIIVAIIIGAIAFMSSGSRSVNKEHIGNWSGRWEGFIVNELYRGSANMSIRANGDAVLTLNAGPTGTIKHTGYVDDNYFFITSGTGGKKEGALVKLSSGFKVVLVWNQVNIDVHLN